MKRLYGLEWFLCAGISSIVIAQCNLGTVSDILSSVDLTVLSSWCDAQIQTCDTLCGGSTNVNDCDAKTLIYTCTCVNNDPVPNLDLYANTIPYFECSTWSGSCFALNPNDLECQQTCNSTYICNDEKASAVAVSNIAAITSVVTQSVSLASTNPSTMLITNSSTITSTALSTASYPTTMSTTSTTTSSPTVGPSTQSLSPGADAGIAIGATLLLLVLALVIWFLVRRRRRQKEGHAGIALVEEQAGAYEKAELDASVERAEFGNSPLPQGNELEGSENERRELGASGAIPELAGEERVELPARGSVRYEAP